MQPYDAIIGLGSNIGDKQANIAAAIEHLTADGALKLVRRSRDFRSAPWGKTDQDWFVNACITVATKLAPSDVLERCFDAERAAQRVRRERWGPRTLDCDLLIYRDNVSDDPHLTLPHPQITGRAFVLVPLIEIAPDAVINGQRATEWLSKLDANGVVAVVSAAKRDQIPPG